MWFDFTIPEKNQKIQNIINSQPFQLMETSLNVKKVPPDLKTQLTNELQKIK